MTLLRTEHIVARTRLALTRLSNYVALSFFLLAANVAVATAAPQIAVVYPQVSNRFTTIFDEIIGGIESNTGDVVRFPLSKRFDIEELRDWLKQKKANAIVTLGRRSATAITALDSPLPTIIGAVLSVKNADKVSGISLTPDPNLLFNKLKELAPEKKRVITIYHTERYAWLIEIAKKAARENQLEFVAEPAVNLKDAASAFKRIMEENDPRRDAVWLLQDPQLIDEKALLSYLLKQAWKRKIVLFSSNPNHVKRGVLFSLYPDKTAIGKRIGAMASAALQGELPAGLIATQDVLFSLNLRTANHLDLQISYEKQREIDSVFPKR